MGKVRLSLNALDTAIELEGCQELEEWFRKILKFWPIVVSNSGEENDKSETKSILIKATVKGYERTSSWLEKSLPHRHPLDAVCDCLVDVTKAYVDSHPDFLCLHCAAIEMDQGLVLFPSTYKAGKSTLSAHLVARGHRIFSDDVLPIDSQGKGMGLGILPRLRIPLPDNGLFGIKDFIKARGGVHSKRYLYLNINESELASFGDKASIRAFVLLERKDDVTVPELEKINRSEILKNTLIRNFSHTVSGPEALIRLHELVASSECYKLTYHKGFEGADRLIQQLLR